MKKGWCCAYQRQLMALLLLICGVFFSAGGVWAKSHEPESDMDKIENYPEFLKDADPCAISLIDMVWPKNFTQCLAPVMVQRVGQLCLTMSWFCTSLDFDDWLPYFLLNNHQVSDVMADDKSVTVLGAQDKTDWQINALRDSDNRHETVVGFSAIEVLEPELNSKSDWQTRHFLDVLRRQKARDLSVRDAQRDESESSENDRD